MGQRLNIEIVNGEDTVANAYYHWSAYTKSAIVLTNQILVAVDGVNGTPVERAVKLLELTGAGVNEDERKRIEEDSSHRFDGIELKDCTSRNEGLLSVTAEGIKETRDWEEGRVTIHLDSRLVDFSVYWEFAKDAYEEDYEEPFEQLPLVSGVSFEGIPFYEFYKVSCLVSTYQRGVRVDDETGILWIQSNVSKLPALDFDNKEK